jgi:alkylhydroperoxidase family enzyme
MRLPDWTPEAKPQPEELMAAIRQRRGGTLLNLDRALLWSEPLARGWNAYLKNVRTALSVSPKLRELGICTVALITGARYEYDHHAPEFLAAGGTQAELDALDRYVGGDGDPPQPLGQDEALVVQYAAAMTRDVAVPQPLFDRVAARFDTTHVVELTAAIATYNMVARFLVALGVSPER